MNTKPAHLTRMSAEIEPIIASEAQCSLEKAWEKVLMRIRGKKTKKERITFVI